MHATVHTSYAVPFQVCVPVALARVHAITFAAQALSARWYPESHEVALQAPYWVPFQVCVPVPFVTERVIGVRRIVAHSIAWMYAVGPEPHSEGDPLDVRAAGTRAITARGVADLERWILSSPPIRGTVLRLGHLYGPSTGVEVAEPPALHVDAAAAALLLAIEGKQPGIFNVAEPSGHLSTERAQRELGFDPGLRFGTAGAIPSPSAPPIGST